MLRASRYALCNTVYEIIMILLPFAIKINQRGNLMARGKRNSNQRKQSSQKKTQQLLKEEQQKIELQKLKYEQQKLKHEQFKNRIANAGETIEQFFISLGRIICYFAFVLMLLFIFLFIGWCIYLYIRGDNTFANIVLTALQVLTGAVSLVVGVWALVLTIQSNRRASRVSDKLNIVVSSTDKNIVGVATEQDVNPDSL